MTITEKRAHNKTSLLPCIHVHALIYKTAHCFVWSGGFVYNCMHQVIRGKVYALIHEGVTNQITYKLWDWKGRNWETRPLRQFKEMLHTIRLKCNNFFSFLKQSELWDNSFWKVILVSMTGLKYCGITYVRST